jgi:hypothetical protein
MNMVLNKYKVHIKALKISIKICSLNLSHYLGICSLLKIHRITKLFFVIQQICNEAKLRKF